MTTINLFHNADDFVSYPAGTVIFREGEDGDVMYAVVAGCVEVLVGDVVVDTTEAGGLIGEMAVIDAAPRSATARARSDCRLVPINQKRFLFLVQQAPFFAVQVMQIMSARLRRRLAETHA